MSVNISPRQLLEADLVDEVRAVLRQTKLDLATLILEITEGALLQGIEETSQKLTGLKALGVKVAIDDFGTGSSSLGYLREFRVDMLKIDRSFVHGMTESPEEGGVLVTAILDLARALHLDVVAEGIELPEQLASLRASGCAPARASTSPSPSPPRRSPGCWKRRQPRPW